MPNKGVEQFGQTKGMSQDTFSLSARYRGSEVAGLGLALYDQKVDLEKVVRVEYMAPAPTDNSIL